MEASSQDRAIGGFLGLELPAGRGGLREFWGFGSRAECYSNARSALQAILLATRNPLWMPAYLCPHFTASVPEQRLRIYPLEGDGSPAVAWLSAQARQGDLILAVNYFGRPPGREFLDFVAARPDLWFIEDCAQALDTGVPAYGDWRLFSPRKLVGVPDGGVAVPCSVRARCVELPRSRISTEDPLPWVDWARPQMARFEDPGETHNGVWHPLNQAKEAQFGVSNRAMSRLSWELLALLDAPSIAAARKSNYAALAQQLPDKALFRTVEPSFVPLGFPIRVSPARRPALLQALYRERIFPAVHWHPLHPAAAVCERSGELSETLITLPCDQRYSVADMDWMARRVSALLG